MLHSRYHHHFHRRRMSEEKIMIDIVMVENRPYNEYSI